MAVKLRLKLAGRKGRAFFRLGAFDSHSQRDGRAVEELGYIDPFAKTLEKQYVLKKERIDYWISKGAQTTESVAVILKKLATGKLYKPAPPPKPKKAKAPKPEEAPKPAAAPAAPEAPKAEAPKAETPKAEAPKTEAPKTETPKAEAPKAEAPKAEAPAAPKAEAPKTPEAPKPAEPEKKI